MALSYFFPPSVARVASRAGRSSLVLAASVAFLFPVSAGAGTDTDAARWTTAAALAVCGALLLVGRGRWSVAAAAFAALAAGALLAPAPWLLGFGAIACLYVATALVPRPAVGAAGADAPGSAAGDGAGDADGDHARHEGREVLDSIAIALVLALVVREFAFEAFKIPTGSMQPTILGDDRVSGRHGDRLLAFKGTFSDPERWQIVVFKYPLFRQTNYIKRLVGLPGEHLELIDGDVYVDGAIVAKPDSVQEVMWQRVVRGAERPEGTFELDPKGGWTFGGGAARLDAAPGSERWIVTTAALKHDLRGSFDVEGLDLAEGGALLVRCEGADRRVTLEVRRDAMFVTAPGRDRVELGLGGADRLGRDFRLGLASSDRIVRVFVDGRMVARMETADAPNESGAERGAFAVGGVAAKATLREFVLEEDVQYTAQSDYKTEFRIPDDGFVMLGDNTASSQDSRAWKANVVKHRDGRTFVAPDDARLDDENKVRTFRSRPDGGVDFVDVDGISRSFAKGEYEVERGVPQPYARRRDLVGPAFFVFFPFPPFGDFRPRFLR